ncbi:sugar ABC transporter ATP-binding protein [Streptosporangium sp. CA-115845]|uniref:sugar ABC transporter ATP-binding protein n=1 Tax=Streptosporangium sp. CA-115845 TaxID=3240071 RepID=UPI003D8DD972
MSPTVDTATTRVLEVTGLTVEFPGVRALDGVDLDVQAGEVHALIGENGAGKSTLLKVLGGVHSPSAGTVLLHGKAYAPRRPSDALAHGIAVIYQEFTLFPALTVAENVYAGREPHSRWSRGIRYGEMRAGCRELFNILGVDIDPDAQVADLSVSEQQLVEIAKALGTNGRVIVMDEPTAALSNEEVERLLDVVRRLRDEGRSVVYVSHRLEEVFAVADRATVLRDGRLVRTLDIADTDEDELVRLMVGRDVGAVFHREAVAEGKVALRLVGVSAGRLLRDVDLDVRAGEIVGIGGVAGAGQAELTQAVFGALPLRAGHMELDGRRYAPATPADALAAGVGFLHEDRKRAGILPDLSIRQNLTVTVLERLRHGLARLLSRRAEERTYAEYAGRLRVRATGPEQLISELSGGNQQKVLLGRALAPGGRVLVLNEPTRGVDIGAKAEIHALVNELTAAGAAVLMVSSDLPELLGASDRIVVLSRGRVVGVLEGEDRTEENVIACATTGRRIGVAA